MSSTFDRQPEDVRREYRAIWGERAREQWEADHARTEPPPQPPAPRCGAGQDGGYTVGPPTRGARASAPIPASRAYLTTRHIVLLLVLLLVSQFAFAVVGIIVIAGVSHIVGRPLEAQAVLVAVVNPAAFGLTFLVAA